MGELYSKAMELVMEYTGLSPTAFFTILTLMVIVYNTVCSMFVDVEEDKNPLHKNIGSSSNALSFSNPTAEPGPAISEAVQLGEVTEEELRAYDGSDTTKPLLMAIKGQIYDVSPSRMFYGPGGPYAMFAGRDASRALALMSFDPQDRTGNIEGLTDSELEVLQDWEYKFMEKYVKVGQLVQERARTENAGSGNNIQEGNGESE